MSQKCYIWREEGYLCVLPPQMDAPVWRRWLVRQDASKRKKVITLAGSYWRVDPSFSEDIQRRFLLVGWDLSFVNPFRDPFFRVDSFEKGKAIQNLSKYVELTSYDVLCVIPSAPKFVVDAAYRALIKKHHPDFQTSEDEIKECHLKTKMLNNAKDEIYKENGW